MRTDLFACDLVYCLFQLDGKCRAGESRRDECKYAKLHDEPADAPTASPWHRVEEPPKEEGKYLVYDGRGNYYVAWWGPRLGWCYDPKFFCYWMPIEPPKEEEHGN